MKPLLWMFAGMLFGAAGGIGGMAWFRPCPKEPHHEVRYHPEKIPLNESPEEFLYPPGATLEMIYPDEAVREAILSPESVSLHRRGGDERLKVKEWAFSGEGIEPDAATKERLLYALASLSAYEPPGSACIFNPGILVRLQKEGHDHDLLFCFECREIGGIAGMSPSGAKTFLKCFCDTFPDDAALRVERERIEGRLP